MLRMITLSQADREQRPMEYRPPDGRFLSISSGGFETMCAAICIIMRNGCKGETAWKTLVSISSHNFVRTRGEYNTLHVS